MSGVDLKQKMMMVRKAEYERLQKENENLSAMLESQKKWDGSVPNMLRESLASVQHEIWSHWMRYLFSRCEDNDLGMIISHDDARHWQRQINTDYFDLSEREKDSDREQADKVINVVGQFWHEINTVKK